MRYDKELVFAEKLLQNFRIKLRYITEPISKCFPPPQNIGLQDILNYKFDNTAVFQTLENQCKANTFYRIKNTLMCNYIVFKLPDTKESVYAYIGPYTISPISTQDILKLAEQYNVAPGNITQLEQFYIDLPLITDENLILTVLYTLGEYLWNNADNFSIIDNFDFFSNVSKDFSTAAQTHIPDEPSLSIKILEERYEIENQLIQAVTLGQLHKAELALSKLSLRQLEARARNSIQDYKNYAIILNTLLRKSAENAAVHPIHLHTVSSLYARKIELITSQTSFAALTKEMVRKYCLIVKNHSLKGYTILVRKTITAINYDLTADLSLKTLAKTLNVNPSYLSTLFKKETGSTLTEYVNRKRIEHAILLLNSTDMQIQTIALYCGIPDVNYFTKTFKKIIGKTPKEYREMIMVHK